MMPPYLNTPPRVINIDVGRQLFVDGFLVESINGPLKTDYHRPEYARSNPVLWATKPWEVSNLSSYGGFASPFSGGVWWDPHAAEYRMYYRCGDAQCIATSIDAERWTKPSLDSKGTNIVQHDMLDGATVWFDLDAANHEPSAQDSRPERPYKMAVVLEREQYDAYTL